MIAPLLRFYPKKDWDHPPLPIPIAEIRRIIEQTRKYTNPYDYNWMHMDKKVFIRMRRYANASPTYRRVIVFQEKYEVHSKRKRRF